jgi:hypothetical protein
MTRKKEKDKGPNSKRGSAMWGWLPQHGHSVFIVSTIIAAIFGGIGIGAAFVSAIVGYQLTELASDEARIEIARANTATAALGKETAAAKERTAALEKEAAEARAEQERLKGQLAWRRLRREQHDAIVAALRNQKFETPLDVSFPLGDTEAASFAAEIVQTLKDSGVAVAGDGASAAAFMPVPPTGIIFGQPGTEQVAHPIAQALAMAGGMQVTIELQSPAAKLVVGSKPSQF